MGRSQLTTFVPLICAWSPIRSSDPTGPIHKGGHGKMGAFGAGRVRNTLGGLSGGSQSGERGGGASRCGSQDASTM